MQRFRGWTRTGLATLVASTLLGVPQLSLARERCEKQGYYNGSNRNSYRDDQGSRYRGRRAEYRDYQESGYRDGRYVDGYGDYRSTRSTGESAAIIGGSAAAGAVVGGLSGGKKGAIIGGAVGGVGGLIYDRATKNRQRYR